MSTYQPPCTITLDILNRDVIVRGIERRDILTYMFDRQNLIDRALTLLSETGVRCFAWAILKTLFDGHFVPLQKTPHL